MPTSADLTFAVILSVDCDVTRNALSELCELLEHDTGREVTPLLARSPSALARALSKGEAHFAWLSPTLLLMVPALARMVPLLSSVREGVAFFHGLVFTAGSSPIERLDDLDGKRAAWVAPTSAAGYLVPRLTLARRGVDLSRALAGEEFLGTHGAVAAAVLEGRADIGATYGHFERGDSSQSLLRAGYTDAAPGCDARILAVSGPIPADMIVVHPDVDLATRVAVAGALSRLPSDPVGRDALRTVIGADDFQAVSSAALEELEALTKASAELG